MNQKQVAMFDLAGYVYGRRGEFVGTVQFYASQNAWFVIVPAEGRAVWIGEDWTSPVWEE